VLLCDTRERTQTQAACLSVLPHLLSGDEVLGTWID